MAHLPPFTVAHDAVNPDQIHVALHGRRGSLVATVTFSRAEARELRDRLAELLDDDEATDPTPTGTAPVGTIDDGRPWADHLAGKVVMVTRTGEPMRELSADHALTLARELRLAAGWTRHGARTVRRFRWVLASLLAETVDHVWGNGIMAAVDVIRERLRPPAARR